LRIGVYAGYISPFSHGAYTMQSSILNAIKKLNNIKHEFIVFYFGNEPILAQNSNIKFISLSNKNNSIFAKGVRYLKRKIDKNYDNTIFNKILIDNKIEILWVISEYINNVIEIPFIYTIWDLEHRAHPFFPEVNTVKKGTQWDQRENKYNYYMKRASFVVTGTSILKKQVNSFYGVPEELVKVIPFPTPEFVFENLNPKIDETKFGFISKKFLFYPATFHSHKNHIVILLALKILKEKYNLDFQAVFTGAICDGNGEFIYEQIKELGLEKNVNLIGHISFDEMVYLYKNAFALVYASFIGPDNLPPLEGFGLKCPVIASNVSGATEQLGDNALIFDPKNEEELAQLILKLNGNEGLRQKLIEKGYNRALSWKGSNYVNEIVKIVDGFAPVRRAWSAEKPYK